MKGPSLKPQQVGTMIWYYEFKGHIELHIDVAEMARRELDKEGVWSVRITKEKLKRSIARMDS